MSKEEILACHHPPILPGIVKVPEIKQSLLNATCYVLAKSLGQENLFSDLATNERKFLFEGEPMILWDLCMYESDKFAVSRRNHAATKIQAAVRGYLARKSLRESLSLANCAAVVIQSSFRGYRVRKQLKKEANKSEKTFDRPLKLPKTRKENEDKTSSNKTSCFEAFFKCHENTSSPSVLYVMGGFNPEMKEGRNVIFKYDLKSKNWSVVATSPVPLHDTRILATHEALYIIGGYNPLDETPLPLKESFKFLLKDEKWVPLSPMIHARSLHAALVFHNMVLVIGGKDERNRILSSIERYDSSKKRWDEHIPLPEPRMAMGAAACKDVIWVAGGITSVGDNISVVDSVWCFDANRGDWFKTFKLPLPLAFPTLLCDGGQLRCIGGAMRVKKGGTYILESIEDIYRLDDKIEMKWKKDALMPLKCHNAVASISDGNIYVFGGFSTENMTQITDVIYFDKNAQKWLPFSDIPKRDAGFMIAMCKQT